MAGMWRCSFSMIVLGMILAILPAPVEPLGESIAHAGFLKDGARPSNNRLKTIRPPRSGTRNRLRTLEERQKQPAAKAAGRTSSRRQQHAWFWKEYAPGLASADPARWARALDTMRARRAKGQGIAPTETVAAIDLAYRRQILGPARSNRLSEALIVGVITVESRGKPQARSHKGAQGLMQLIPATAKRFGVSDAYRPDQNIAGGAAYLDWLLREFNGDPLLALAGYNAGEGAVRKHKGVPPFAETRDYVVKVLDAIVAASEGCADPLVSPRTPCRRAPAGPSG